MAARAPFRRRPLSLTSLIDVIFLLLLFFMLTTTFTRTAELPLIAATGGPGAVQDRPVFLRLGADSLSVNGQTTEIAEVTQRITSVAQISATAGTQAEAQADMQAKAQAEAQVLISLGPDVTAQRLADLLAVLRGAPGLRVQVLG